MIPEQMMETKKPRNKEQPDIHINPHSPLFLIMGSEQTIWISDGSQPPAVAN